MKKILIIEDDPAILKGLIINIKAEGYLIEYSSDGLEGYKMAENEKFDLIILDVMLPNKDGFEICRDLRINSINTPILMLTSKKDEIDKVLGLELGADDYMTKPFSIRELIARIKAITRRNNNSKNFIEETIFDGIKLNFREMEAVKNGDPVKLTALEFKILKYLIEREGEVISRDRMLDDVWGYDTFPTTRTVDNYILSIRKKLEDNQADPKHILTIHKSGYKFVR